MSRSTQKISAKDILSLTNQGRDIWEREVGAFSENKNIKSPLRTGDNDPSFRIKLSKSGVYIGKDHGGEQWRGDAIAFIEKIYGLSFSDACSKIIGDYGLQKGFDSTHANKIISTEVSIKKQVPLIYEWESMPFKKEHHAYWNKGHLTEEFLKPHNIFAVKKWAINKVVQPITEGEITFVYFAEDLQKEKILRIGLNVPFKWRTNIPNAYLWYFNKYKDKKIEDLFVLKSVKDLMVMYLLEYEGIATQSENASILDLNIPLIQEVCSNPIICMGSDPQGVQTCTTVQQKHSTRYMNTPKNLLKYEINDPFSYVAEFGLKRFDNFIKLKI